MAGSFSFFFFFLFLSFGLNAKSHDQQYKSYIYFSLLSLSNFLFLLGFFLQQNTSHNLTLFSLSNRLAIAAAGFNVSFIIHFYKLYYEKTMIWDVKIIYAVNILFTVLSIFNTRLFMYNEVIRGGNYYISLYYGVIFKVWGAYIILIMLYAAALLFKQYIGEKRQKKDNITSVLFYASIIWCISSSLDALSALRVIDFPPLTWVGSLMMIIPLSVILLSKINVLHRKIQNLYMEVIHDSLTNVYSRSYFNVEFEEALIKAKRKQSKNYLIIIDIDNFKEINDKYGHLTGDKAIQMVANVLKQKMRDYDLISRYGGDEFVILITEEVSPMTIQSIAERLKESIHRALLDTDRGDTNITCSFGITSFDRNTVQKGADTHSIFHAADTALYLAKKSGKHQIKFIEYEQLEFYENL